MKYLGIDYGSKRIGVAKSDDEGKIAFPYLVLENNSGLIEKIKEIILNEKVGAIVIGESKDFEGKDNKIMSDIREFIEILRKEVNIELFLEPEFLTSHQAEKIQGKNEMLDASAASIILQSFLNKINL